MKSDKQKIKRFSMYSSSNPRLQKGYTLLFSVITATVVLGVAVFILSVSKKQFALSVVARESMYAFYAADAGIECLTLVTASTTDSFTINCNGNTAVDVVAADFEQASYPGFASSPQPYKLRDPIIIPFDDGRCASIMIVSGKNTNIPAENVTVIESRGYNQCNSTGPLPSIRTVERALRLTQR